MLYFDAWLTLTCLLEQKEPIICQLNFTSSNLMPSLSKGVVTFRNLTSLQHYWLTKNTGHFNITHHCQLFSWFLLHFNRSNYNSNWCKIFQFQIIRAWICIDATISIISDALFWSKMSLKQQFESDSKRNLAQSRIAWA